MRKVRYREIIRLHAGGLNNTEVAASVGCSRETVRQTVRLAGGAGLSWPLPEGVGDARLMRLLHPGLCGKSGDCPEPDWERVHVELARKGVTVTLPYGEYRDSCAASGRNPCSFTTFCRHCDDWCESSSVVVRVRRRPGETLEVDWAGARMHLVDRDTGEIVGVHVFVACLPFSKHLYAEGFLSMDEGSWLTAHAHAPDFIGGVPEQLVPDNCKTAVTSHVRGRPAVVNRSYADMAEHYGCAVVPTRVRAPRDKANVEAGVGVVTRRAIAALRDEVFFTLGEPNAALQAKVAEINASPFAKAPGSRRDVFVGQERSALSPLPAEPFEVCRWLQATVRRDYRVQVDGSLYSVPFQYIRAQASVGVTRDAVEVFVDDARVASHPRARAEGPDVLDEAHMPQNHRDFLDWDVAGLVRRAEGVGPCCAALARAVSDGQPTKQRSIGRLKSLMALARYGSSVLEACCARASAASPSAPPAVEAVEMPCRAAYLRGGDVEDRGEFAILRGFDYYGEEE